MGRTLGTWTERARELLGNPKATAITDTSLEDHVLAAVRRFSSDQPLILTADFAGNGASYDLAISSIPGWVNGFSTVEGIEYPQGKREALFLDASSWTFYPPTSAPTAIRLLSSTPNTGETTRVFFTAPWPLPASDPAADLVPDFAYEPVVALAASRGASQLAGNASGHTMPTLPQADLAGSSTEAARWLQLVKDLEGQYLTLIGGGDNVHGPASGWVQWKSASDWRETGGGYLLRPPPPVSIQ